MINVEAVIKKTGMRVLTIDSPLTIDEIDFIESKVKKNNPINKIPVIICV